MYYLGICKEKGILVPEEYSFGFALERILNNNKDKREFTEWFYSGDWLKIENGGDEI